LGNKHKRRAYKTAMRKKRPIRALLVVSLVLCGLVLLFVLGQGGAFVTAVEMDRSSGDKRRVLYIYNTSVRAWPDTPMWFAEYATERREDWVTVQREWVWPGKRVNWRWGAAHLTLHSFGEHLRDLNVGEDVTRTAGEELLQLIRSEQYSWFLVDVMNDVSSDMVESVERGEPLDAEGVRAAFGRAVAGRRADGKP
jgi:hypothetical protein